MTTEQAKLVFRVNELFHDLEQEDYDSKHKDIFIDEVERWKKIGKAFLKNRRDSLTILDIGSGTGFVPLQLGAFLKKQDCFVCSDISGKILDVCKTKIAKENFNCEFKFLKTDGIRVNLPDNSVDFITLNSVLHHIPDITSFFKETDRLLKKNGMLIIGHEPNSFFFSNQSLWRSYRIIYNLANPRQFCLTLAKKIRLFELLRAVYFRLSKKTGKHEKIIKQINDQLLADKLIQNSLAAEKIFELVDIHSPTAGKIKKNKKGFDVFEINNVHLPNFKIEHFETYSHMSRLSFRNIFFKRIDSILQKKLPNKGSMFLVAFAKKE